MTHEYYGLLNPNREFIIRQSNFDTAGMSSNLMPLAWHIEDVKNNRQFVENIVCIFKIKPKQITIKN